MKAGFRLPLRSRFVLQWQGFGSFAWSIDWWTPRGSIRTSHLGMQPLSRKKHRGKPESFKFKFSKVISSSVTRNDFHTSKVCSRDHDQRKHKWTHKKWLIFTVWNWHYILQKFNISYVIQEYTSRNSDVTSRNGMYFTNLLIRMIFDDFYMKATSKLPM